MNIFLRVLMIALFGYSSISKLNDPSHTIRVLESVGTPRQIAIPIVTIVIIAELFLACCLLFQIEVRMLAVKALIGMMVLFSTFLVGILLTNGPIVGCGCGGALELYRETKAGVYVGLIRNAIILGILALLHASDKSAKLRRR